MMRRSLVAVLALLVVAGFAVAADVKEASGTVKAVAADTLTVTDTAAKDWTFSVDKETSVQVPGGSHKMDKLTAEGKPPLLTEFVTAKKAVVVKYVEKDGKMIAREIRVK